MALNANRSPQLTAVLLLAAIPRLGLCAPTSGIDAQLQRVVALIEHGDLATATTELQRLAKTASQDARVYNLLGVVSARANRFADAESDFRRAIALAPRFVGAYMNLGRLYQEHENEQGPAGKALEVYLRVLGVVPDDVEANYQAALLLSRAGQFGRSLEHLERLPADARQRAAAVAVRCVDYAGLGRMAAANSAAEQLLSAPDLAEADVLLIAAPLHARASDGITLKLLQALAARNLASPAGLQALARMQEAQGKFHEARETLERDLQAEPPSVPVLLELARVAYEAKDLEGALGYVAHARDLEPANAAIHYLFGLICVDLKLPPEARQSLEKAVSLDAANAYYHYALGAVLLQQKDAQAAVAQFRAFRDARPQDPRGSLALGIAYFDSYELDAARKELQTAAAHNDTRSGGNLYLGRLAFREDRLDEAADFLQHAIQANGSAPDAYAELALVQLRRDQYAAAERNLGHALKIAPDHYRSNLNLLALYQRTKDPRAAEQARRVEQLQRAGEERERMLLRSLDIRPY